MLSQLFPRARAVAGLRRGMATLVITGLLLPPALLVNPTPAVAMMDPTRSAPASIPKDRPLTSTPVTISQNETDPPMGEPLPDVGFPAPLALELTSSAAVVAPGETVTVTVHVAPAAGELPPGLHLTLALMPGVRLMDPATAVDALLPALAVGSSWTQALPVVVDGAEPLAWVDATVDGGGYLPVTQRLWLGVVDPAQVAQDGITTATVGANGVTVRGGDQRVTLAAPPAALPLGAQVNYVLRWDWRNPAPPAAPRPTPDPSDPTPPAPVLAAVTLFLPQVQLARGDQTLAATPSVPVAPQTDLGTDPSYVPNAETTVGMTDDGSNVPVLNESGVSFFALWEITATATLTTPSNLAVAVATEPTSIHWLGAEALLVVGVGDLVTAGVAPDTLHLWTRDQNAQPWREVPSRYDPEAQVLRAWLPHFTQVGLGQGLTVGDTLPNVSAFTTDALTGAATVHLPIETPAGLGGLAPALSVSYSSIVMDDLYRTAGAGAVKTATGPLGLGWSLNGVSYVERTGGSLDDDTQMPNKQFAVVLNGVRAGLNYVDGAWRTNPATFAQVAWQYEQAPNSADRGNWIITTTQGIRYEFGEVLTGVPLTATNQLTFSATSASATFLPQKTGGDTYRLTRRWYLRQATDRFGNQLEVHYRGEAAYKNCQVATDWREEGRNWYTSAIDPAEILWSGQQGAYALRVRFNYDGAIRSDAYIAGSDANDCDQPFFGVRNRLTAVDVQYNDFSPTNNWHTLRRYQFGQSYTGTSPNRLTLNQVEQVGSGGTVQWRNSFTYEVSNPNQVWLQSAKNGVGGQVDYGYTSYRVSCSNSTCQQGDLRRAVALATTYDGLGHKSATQYTYGPANQAGSEWGVVSDDGSFLGYMEADVTHYDTVSASSTSLGGQLQYERLFSYSDGAGEARDNPDPRAGRQRRRQVWANQGAASGPALLTEEAIIQAYWWENGGWNEATPVTTSWKMVNRDAVFPGAWIREEQRTTTQVDGSNTIVASQVYSYAVSQQNNGQYGNRTHVLDLADGQLQRTTVTEYFPNPTYNLVSLPARVTVLDSSGVCKSEARTLYGAQFVNNVYSPTSTAAYATPPQWPLVMRTQQRLQGGCSAAGTAGDRDANWAVTQQTYDQYGQGTVTRDLGESVTADAILTTTYDSVYHTFPVAQATGTAPVLQETAAYYGVNVVAASPADQPNLDAYAAWGALAEYCAPHGVCARQAYDEFGRRTFRWDGMQHTDTWASTVTSGATVRWDYRDPFVNAGYQTTSVAEWQAPRCTGNFVRRQYNGLGQLVQEQRPDEAWAYSFDNCTVAQNLAEIDVDYLYDGLGRQIRTGVPHATTASWVNRAANWIDGYTSTQYDATGRVTKVTAYNGNVQEYYYGSRASWVIAKGRDSEGDRVVSWQQTDGLGNVRSVRSYNPGGATGTWALEGEVGLTHDVLGNLVAVNQPTGRTTTMTYDMAGRKLSMTDPDLGAWSYEYARRGQLTKQTDTCANVTRLTYDSLDRLSVQTVTAGSNLTCNTTPEVGASVNYTYTYDVGQAALGQLTGVRSSDGSYSKNLLYDADGRVRAEGIAIFGSINYTTSYTYDAYQRLVVTTYPGGEKVRVGYNSMGLPETLTSTAVISPLVSGVDYDAAGRPVTLSLAGGWLQRTQRYGPWNTSGEQGGQLLGITVTQGSSVVAALGYTYDAFGNVQTLKESGGTPAAFDYDGQNRLVSAYAHNYLYDSAGRTTLFEGGTGFTFDSVHPHAVNTVNTVDRYDYDANGNLTMRNKGLSASQVLTWTADNRLAMVKSSTLTERYAYAPDGERIWRETNGAVTRTPFAHYEVDVANNIVTRYYYFGGQMIAMRQGSTQPTYLHTDALGSVVAASPVGGTTSALQRYCGYGRIRSAGSGGTWNCGTAANLFDTDRTYTGQQADGTGLMYYHARYYDPAAGQFISPDTLVPDPTNVMDYQRYAYARANPLRYSDPTGHESCAAGDTACWESRWNWMNRWYEAHGYFWNGSANHWSNVADPRFADEAILDDTVGEAGIQWSASAGDALWTLDRKIKIATGIVQFGQRLSGGLQRISELVGGRATMRIANGGNLICRGGDVACTLPTWSNTVVWPAAFIDAYSKAYIGAQAVHELAHVIDWQSGMRFSASWSSRGLPALTEYAACAGCIQQWESWAEAVAVFTYGQTYINYWISSKSTFSAPSAASIRLQANAIQALLEGWVTP